MFNRITDNVEIHQTLPDTPNMTTQELKREWDKGNKIIKESFNALVGELNKIIITSKVLYEDSVGSTEEIALSDTVLNYDRIKIFYRYQDIYGSVEGDNVNNKILSLSISFGITELNLSRVQYKYIKIDGNRIINRGYGYLSASTNGTVDVNIDENKIYITKVIGYKEGNNE